jgi:DNA repair photolyase
MIISASRRTDIPAFYSEWFINRVKAGFLFVRNPFNYNQITRVSLLREDVDLFVFWTRNPKKIMDFLPSLDEMGYRYYFQYTITGYSRKIERSVPKTLDAIATFINLSDRIGKDKVIWRYDPILMSNLVDLNEHKRLFKKIADHLESKTNRVVISFADFYKKTERNLKAVDGLVYSDILQDNPMLVDLSEYMVKIAQEHDMQIQSCSEKVDLSSIGVPHGKCIDDALIKDVFGISLSDKKDKGQREECGCVKSVDIGMYNTCLHECSYCYATFNKKMVVDNKKKHDPSSPFLIGGSEGIVLDEPSGIQGSLF